MSRVDFKLEGVRMPSDLVITTEYTQDIDRIREQILSTYTTSGTRKSHDNVPDFSPYTNFGESTYEIDETVLDNFYGLIREVSVYYCDGNIKAVCNSSFWWAHYPPGTFHAVHTHERSDLSLVWMLEDAEDSSLVFSGGRIHGSHLQTAGLSTLKIPTKKGKVVIFPSGLPHYTTASTTTRTIISFNFNLTDFSNDSNSIN